MPQIRKCLGERNLNLEVLKKALHVVVIAGEDKLDQVACPSKQNAGFNSLPDFPQISREALEAQALVDLSIFRKYIDQLRSRMLHFGFFR